MNQLDVLYTPLDVPDRPDIDLDNFLTWCKESYATEEQRIVREDLCGGTAHNKLNPTGQYAWDITYAKYDDKWLNGFDEKFPELATYTYEAFGVLPHEYHTILYLPLRESIRGEAFWHSDVDLTGFRYYLFCENPEENPLLMRRFKKTHNERPSLILPVAENDPRISTERLICKMIRPTQSYYLNNIRAVHAPSVGSDKSIFRIACLVKCKLEYEKEVFDRSKDLILRSANKFKDYAIFW